MYLGAQDKKCWVKPSNINITPSKTKQYQSHTKFNQATSILPYGYIIFKLVIIPELYFLACLLKSLVGQPYFCLVADLTIGLAMSGTKSRDKNVTISFFKWSL